MPGSEFRLLPRLPLEFKTYRVINPADIGKALTKGWLPVAVINFEEYKENVGQLTQTQFLVGKGMKAGTHAAPSAGPTPVLMFQPQDVEEELDNTPQVQQLLDRIALMSPEEVLELHKEIQQQKASPVDDEDDLDEVREAMDELLDTDDGSEDDDE